jgi:GTP-binding protein
LAEDPLLDFAQINTELALFDPDLAKKPQIVAVTKMDIPEVKNRWEEICRNLKKKGILAMDISAATGSNVRNLLDKTYELLQSTPVVTKDTLVPVYHPQTDPRQYEIQRIPTGWRITGASIERAAAMTYWENDDSIRRFQRILKALGIDEALRQAGVKEGDMVSVGEYELEWTD